MARHLSTVIGGIVATLAAWAADVTPAGSVTLAADRDEGMAAMMDAPASWRLTVWVDGEGVEENSGRKGAELRLKIGVTVARGLAATVRKELTEGRGTLPPVLDIIEGVIAKARGLYINEGGNPCLLLDYEAWDWVRFEIGVDHHVAQTSYILRRELAAPVATALTLPAIA